MRFTKKIWTLLGVIISIYLILPMPKLPPTESLPEAYKSDEPGDTWQLINVSAYYTNKERADAIPFYQNYFSSSSSLPMIRLNHPPEYAKEVFIDTKQTYYLEELIYPMRQSLFINGYEWENDVFTPVASRKQFILEAGGKVWKSKVSLKWFSSNLFTRLIVFWFSWTVLLITLNLWVNEFGQLVNIFKRGGK